MAEGEVFGWMAGGLTLLSVSMRSIMALRTAAVAASLCFIVFGALGAIYPVLALHILLLPCNLLRLHELHRSRAARTPPP